MKKKKKKNLECKVNINYLGHDRINVEIKCFRTPTKLGIGNEHALVSCVLPISWSSGVRP